MFSDCINLESVTFNLNKITPNGTCNISITDGEKMFFNCTTLKDIPSIITNVRFGSNMFTNCISIKSIPTDFFKIQQSLNYGNYLNRTFKSTFENCSGLLSANV
jgi:hypothetical protein